MMRINTRATINTSRINSRMTAFQGKLNAAVKTQLYLGATDFTPYRDGDLFDSAQGSAYDETPYLIYNIVYARYQYYANGGAPTHDFPGRYKYRHSKATMLWIDEYLAAGGKYDIQIVCNNAPGVLKF